MDGLRIRRRSPFRLYIFFIYIFGALSRDAVSPGFDGILGDFAAASVGIEVASGGAFDGKTYDGRAADVDSMGRFQVTPALIRSYFYCCIEFV